MAPPFPSPRYSLRLGNLVVTVTTPSEDLDVTYGPRFDRTARVTSVRLCGAEFLDPRGLADEFGISGAGVLGFDATAAGGQFIKIGVGALVRPNDEPYSFTTHYPVAEYHPVSVETAEKWVLTRQEGLLGDFAYSYEKRIEVAGEDLLLFTYRIINHGKEPLDFEHYNHNFLCFEERPVNDDYAVDFSEPIAVKPPSSWNQVGLRFVPAGAAPERGGGSWGADTDRAGPDFRVTVLHANGQSLRISGDFSPHRFALWAIRNSLSPEIFYRATVPPGASVRWVRSYAFGRVKVRR